MMKKVYKYGTGQEIPKGAVYLGTVRQTKKPGITPNAKWEDCWLVWHYFLVEVEKEEKLLNKNT